MRSLVLFFTVLLRYVCHFEQYETYLVLCVMSDFSQIHISLTDFHKKSIISSFTKSCPMAAKLIHADGWGDKRDKDNTHTAQIL